MKTRQQDQIAKRLAEVSSMTQKLKAISYSMANIQLETVKHNSSFKNASLLTTIDSIYFDLKRIETILLRHSRPTKNSQYKNQPSEPLNSDSSSIIHEKNKLRNSQLATFNIQSYNLTPKIVQTHKMTLEPFYSHSNFSFQSNQAHIDLWKTNELHIKNIQFVLTNKIEKFHFFNSDILTVLNYSSDHNFQKPLPNQVKIKKYKPLPDNPNLNIFYPPFDPQEVSQCTEDDQKNFISQTLPMKVLKKRKQSHEVGITQVSSQEYVGLSHNPTIKGRFHQPADDEFNQSQSNKKSALNSNQFQLEECQKEAENQAFLREISRSREKILRSIERKKAKCFNAISSIHYNIIQVTPDQESKLKKNKLKSKTQKFYTQGFRNYPNHLNEMQSSGQFVGI